MLFSFCWWFHLLCRSFIVWCSPISLFFFLYFLCPRKHISKNLLWEMSEMLLPMFSSRIFMASQLTFKSFIHFEFIFMYGICWWSSFIYSQYLSNFSKHHLSKRLSLLHGMLFPPLSNVACIGMVRFLGCLFHSVDLYACCYASTWLFWLQCPCIIWY